MSRKDNLNKLMNLLDKHNLDNEEKEELLSIIMYIFNHDEFQRRMTKEFYHHDKITLGEHILEDTIVTYILSKKLKDKKDYDINIAVKTAMFHDLYVYPWQNNPSNVEKRFCNKHGFRHPNEAIVNAITWFKDDFRDLEKSKKIIDGVIHHMYPFPVTKFDISSYDLMELNNFNMIGSFDKDIIDILMESGNRFTVGDFSIALSKYKEGQIMNLSDKIVSISNLKGSNINGYKALITGKNKNLTLK